MSDQPKKNLNDADKQKSSSSNNEFLLENSEPCSDPLTLPSVRTSLDTDEKKKIKTGPKAVLPGAVAETVAASNDKQLSSIRENTLTEFVSDKEETSGSNYRRRKVAPPRYISEPTAVRNKKGSFPPASNTAENQMNASTIATSLEDSEPSALPVSMKSSGADKTGPKAVLPGAVAETVPAEEGFKGNKYQRKIAASRGISGATRNNEIYSSADASTTNAGSSSLSDNDVSNVNTSAITSILNLEPDEIPLSNDLVGEDQGPKSEQPAAIQQSAIKVSNFLLKDSGARKHRQRKDSSTGNQNSSSDNLAMKVFDDDDDDGVTMTYRVTTTLENSEPSVLPDLIDVSDSMNAYGPQQLHVTAGGNDVPSISESYHIPAQSSQDNAQLISHDTPETQGLVVATLVESNRDIYGTDVIVDAIVIDGKPIDDKPTPWYRRTLLMLAILVVAAIAVSAAVTALIFGESNGTETVPVFQSVAPTLFHSNTPSIVPSLSLLPSPVPSQLPSPVPSQLPSRLPSQLPSRVPSPVPTFVPTLSPSFILRALYDSTDGMNWSNKWDFNSDQSYCDFIGITCDELDQITEIILYNNNLRGSIPTEIGSLSSLLNLYLFSNSITGTIPTEIGMLSSLTGLYLHYNSITGTIPIEIGGLSSLVRLYLFSNSITGTIPNELGMLSSSVWFFLDINSITGTIPMELCALTGTSIYYDGDEISCTCIVNSDIGTPCNEIE